MANSDAPSYRVTVLIIVIITAVILIVITYTDSSEYLLDKNIIYQVTTQQNSWTLQYLDDLVHENSKNYSIFVPKEWKIIYYQKPRKTGGTALAQLLAHNGLNKDTNQTKKRCYNSAQPEKFIDIKNRCINRGHKVFGNEYWPFYTHSYLMYKHEQWSDVLMLTLLRNPINRVFSDLLYTGTWKCQNINYRHWIFPESGLIDCVHQNHAKFTSNVYTKTFSGIWPYANPNHRLLEKGVKLNPNISVTDVHLQVAKSIIAEFDVILILEQWESTSVLMKCHGLHNTSLPHANIGKIKKANAEKVSLDTMPKLYEEIVKYNSYDMQLYQYAQLLAEQKSTACRQYLVKQNLLR